MWSITKKDNLEIPTGERMIRVWGGGGGGGRSRFSRSSKGGVQISLNTNYEKS